MANQIISHSLAFSRSYIYINIQFVGCLITRRKSRSTSLEDVDPMLRHSSWVAVGKAPVLSWKRR